MRVHVPVQLRWGDLDAYNHVNNVSMMRVLEEARVRAFWAPEHDGDERHPTSVFPREGDSHSVIAGHRIEYLRQVEYQRAPLDVQLWLSRVGGASFEIGYEVFSVEGLAVRASSTLVLVRRDTGAPRRLTAAERDAWAAYHGEPVEFRHA